MVPRLLDLLDNTTNWYIRFNRKRLKGELGLDDTLQALNTLFEVLFTLMRGLAPFAPFLTDNIYLHLLPYIPEYLQAKDPRSVHFLSFPNVREELFDEIIERRVAHMQRVIELGRVSRERRGIGLKIPLKSLVIIHRDPAYLEDVRSLQRYIIEELNVRDLIASDDEDKYGVRYIVTADWPTLGKKLKKDAQKVKKALPSLSSNQVRDFMTSGNIDVSGITLTKEDLLVKRSIDETKISSDSESNTDDDILIILDVKIYPELAIEGLAREIINRVQRLRKSAGLVPTDDLRMEYNVLSDPDYVGLADAFESQAATIEKVLRRPIDKHTATEVEGQPVSDRAEKLIVEEEQEIQNARFMLSLLRL